MCITVQQQVRKNGHMSVKYHQEQSTKIFYHFVKSISVLCVTALSTKCVVTATANPSISQSEPPTSTKADFNVFLPHRNS